MKSHALLVVILTLVCYLPLSAQSDEKFKYGYKTKTSTSGILRDKPSSNGKILAEIPKGERISIFNNFQSPYFYVIYGDKTGYLSYSSIVLDETIRAFIESKTEGKRVATTNSESINKSNPQNRAATKSSTYKSKASRVYHRGPRGGCYYINSNGNKVYVDRSLCN